MQREEREKKKQHVYTMLELSREGDRLSEAYDIFMMCVIGLSLLPLMVKKLSPPLAILDRITVGIFIVDYILRWSTADLKFGSRSLRSYLRYPFTFMAIVDLLSILPSLTVLNNAFKVLRLLRMGKALRALRVMRAFRAIRYSKSVRIIQRVLRNSRDSLAAVGTLALAYILISALIIFNAEPDSFGNFFEAVYWATVSLTTVGYGDITPISTAGRIVAMLSSLFGVAIVALPSGIITAGYIRELEQLNRSSDGGGDEQPDAEPQLVTKRGVIMTEPPAEKKRP